ncbi:uncharacterized protein Dere_GG27212 [Drosophila erecta]|uniref:Uncharacterized protein n=1 Tax=Drosophila erecta TaxID=7220 RepID=A0A0Q5WA36_DROER|nr:uncharacterized protein Dere_GG27212 [Drosophila erecta]
MSTTYNYNNCNSPTTQIYSLIFVCLSIRIYSTSTLLPALDFSPHTTIYINHFPPCSSGTVRRQPEQSFHLVCEEEWKDLEEMEDLKSGYRNKI